MNKDGYARLAKLKLLDQRHNLVHGVYLTDRELKTVLDTGASVTVTPEVESLKWATAHRAPAQSATWVTVLPLVWTWSRIFLVTCSQLFA